MSGRAAAAQAAERVLARVLHRNPGYSAGDRLPRVVPGGGRTGAGGGAHAARLGGERRCRMTTTPGFCRAFVLSGLGRLEEAVLEVKRGGARDGAGPRLHGRVCLASVLRRAAGPRPIDFAGEALEMRPDNDVLHAIVSSAHALRGDAAAALAAATNAVAVSGGNAPALAALAYAHAACGQAQAALAILGRLGPG